MSMKWFDKSFRDLKLVPGLNTTVGIIFEGSDNPHPIYVKVIGYNGKISELDTFIVLVNYHGILLERRLYMVYPIPLSVDIITQFGWGETDEIEKGDGISYRYGGYEGTVLSKVSIKVIYYPGIGKEGRWVLSLKDIPTQNVLYLKVKWFHDLSRIYEFLKGISGLL